MKKLEYAVRFITPAFLGNAFQKGQWRTPPFKALLRQWWRVVEAQKHSYDHKELRETEGRLFGHAWLKDLKGNKWAAQAKLKMKLDLWKEGELSQLRSSVNKVKHPEVKFSVDSLLYLGYGPVEYDGKTKGAKLKRPPTIREDSTSLWSLYWRALPHGEDDFNSIKEAIKLVYLFGTVGGRSRNGWGSIQLKDKNGNKLPDVSEMLNPENKESRKWLYKFARNWTDALKLDWCHAIGKNEEGLLSWRSEGDFSSWQEAMRHLAEIKIDLRTQFHFKGAGPHNSLCDRQILAYPVTKHSLKKWGRQSRSANQLLFKVHKVGERYIPIIVHLPHGVPNSLEKKLEDTDKKGLRKREEIVWQKIHKVLDLKMQRLP